jgi:23S rRNA pseudouridine1911/1915/1917 synthase
VERVTTITAGQSRLRLDVFVSAQSARVSRAAAQRWIASGLITVNGRPAKPARRIRPGDVVASHVPVRARPPVDPEPLALAVLHEDGALLVLDKPPGVVMHPAHGHWTGTLLNGLVHHVARDAGDRAETSGTAGAPAEAGRRARPGLVHRLDRGTSGVIVVAKTDAALRELSRQFRVHSVERVYLAVVAGTLRRGGVIDLAIGRDAVDRRRVSPRSAVRRRAVTEVRVVERLGGRATLVEARPRTGRMHQIRVHLASLGHPVLGDLHYGAPAHPPLPRPLLHAARLGFVHPVTGARVAYEAPLPADLAAVLSDLRTLRTS